MSAARTLANPKYRAELEREATQFLEQHNVRLRERGSDVASLSLDLEREDDEGTIPDNLDIAAIESHGSWKETDPRYKEAMSRKAEHVARLKSKYHLAYPAAGDEMDIEEREQLFALLEALIPKIKSKTLAKFLQRVADGQINPENDPRRWLPRIAAMRAEIDGMMGVRNA